MFKSILESKPDAHTFLNASPKDLCVGFDNNLSSMGKTGILLKFIYDYLNFPENDFNDDTFKEKLEKYIDVMSTGFFAAESIAKWKTLNNKDKLVIVNIANSSADITSKQVEDKYRSSLGYDQKIYVGLAYTLTLFRTAATYASNAVYAAFGAVSNRNVSEESSPGISNSDCSFHAPLGIFNPVMNQVEAGDIAGKGKKAGNPNKGYIRNEVIADGECGYTAFGITRKKAVELLNGRINDNNVMQLLKPAIKEFLLRNEFYQYIKNKKITSLPIETIQADSDRFSSDSAIIAAFIDFDVRDGKLDAGWAHPATLQALAEAQKIEIYIWQSGDGQRLVPHNVGNSNAFFHRRPENHTSRVDLLFINGNHFERLEFQGYGKDLSGKEQFPTETEVVYPFKSGKSQRTKTFSSAVRPRSPSLLFPAVAILPANDSVPSGAPGMQSSHT